MNDVDYRFSFKKRLAILFSPVRLVLFAVAIVWSVVFNAIFIANLGEPWWAGPVSVIPLLAWVTWLFVTDARQRALARAAR